MTSVSDVTLECLTKGLLRQSDDRSGEKGTPARLCLVSVTDRHPSTDALAPTETYARCVAVMEAGSGSHTFTRVVVLVLVLAATSCAGRDDSPSAGPGSASSPPRTLTPSQRTKLELRPVINIIPSSSPDWKKSPVTCELQDGALRGCLISTLDLSRVVLVAGPPGGPKYVLGPVIVDAADVARAEATYEPSSTSVGQWTCI
jgi:hypothetical protein